MFKNNTLLTIRMNIKSSHGVYLQNLLRYSYDENLICIAYLYKTNLKHINVKKTIHS